MLFDSQPAVPNTGNFLLLVLAVWGAIVDYRYKARGGKQPPKWLLSNWLLRLRWF